jgi:hypothetical protein
MTNEKPERVLAIVNRKSKIVNSVRSGFLVRDFYERTAKIGVHQPFRIDVDPDGVFDHLFVNGAGIQFHHCLLQIQGFEFLDAGILFDHLENFFGKLFGRDCHNGLAKSCYSCVDGSPEAVQRRRLSSIALPTGLETGRHMRNELKSQVCGTLICQTRMAVIVNVFLLEFNSGQLEEPRPADAVDPLSHPFPGTSVR